jgi:hypothetical protein
VDGLIGVRRGWVLRVKVDVGRRLALVGQSRCLELGARLATMCERLRKNSKMISNYAELSIRMNK